MLGQVEDWGRRVGPAHGGGPLSSLQDSLLPNEFNPVNHAFRRGEMTENCLRANPLRALSRLGQTAANGVTYQTRCFVDIEFLHESGSMRFSSFYTDAQVYSDILRGLSFTH